MVCVLTGWGVLRGRYCAVGEPRGGYMFLPPWELWAGWARAALRRNLTDPRLLTDVECWLDGTKYLDPEEIPV